MPPYDHPLLEGPLAETLGVVVFQEQVLEVAMALAGFSVGEAEGLRRAMSRKRSREAIEAYRESLLPRSRLREAWSVRSPSASSRSSSASRRSASRSPTRRRSACSPTSPPGCVTVYPAEFLCALLNAQPMGFYPPASLVRDGQRRGVEVLPPDVNTSGAPCALERGGVRVGLAYVREWGRSRRGRSSTSERRVVRSARCRISPSAPPSTEPALEALAASGACDGFGWPRRQLLWRLGLAPAPRCSSRADSAQLALPLEPQTEIPDLPEQSSWERMLTDYRLTSLSVDTHPLDLLRPHLPAGVVSSLELDGAEDGAEVAVAGLVVARQRPSDRERGRVHAARGRARADEPDRAPAASTTATARPFAASRSCSRGAGTR